MTKINLPMDHFIMLHPATYRLIQDISFCFDGKVCPWDIRDGQILTVKQPGCWVGTVNYLSGGLSDGPCLEAIQRVLVFQCSVFDYDRDQDVRVRMFMNGQAAHFELSTDDEQWREVHNDQLRSLVHLIFTELSRSIDTVPEEYRVEALRLLGVMVVAKLIGVDEE